MLADLAATLHLAVVIDEELAVPDHDVGDLAQVRRRRRVETAEFGGQFGEQPGPAEATAADDDALVRAVLAVAR